MRVHLNGLERRHLAVCCVRSGGRAVDLYLSGTDFEAQYEEDELIDLLTYL